MAVSAGQPQQPAPPAVPVFPGIYQRPAKPTARWLRPRPLIILALLGLAVVWLIVKGVDDANHAYKVDMLTVRVENPQSVDIEFRVHNLGGSAWQPQCSVTAQPLFGGGIGTGQFSTYTPIDAGQYGDVGGTVVISNNDAQAVTKSDVSISC